MPAAPEPASSALRIAFYGDDFTGSTDTLATLSQAGLRALLFLGVPTPEQLAAAGTLDALGIAGAARSMAPPAMRGELERVGRFFASLQPAVVHYKTCSTFDSAPHTGSIGTAVSALLPFVSSPLVAIIGGQPNLGRYCVFGNLFAAVSAGGPVVRIDRHPTMRAHPVTPMLEADLRLHLAAQGLSRVTNVDWRSYQASKAALDAQVAGLIAERPDAVLFDVGHAADLAAIGRIVWQHATQARVLAVGPSGVTQALLAHWAASGNPVFASARIAATDRVTAARDPVFVLAGSQSPVTARQIGHATSYIPEPLDAKRLVAKDQHYVDAWMERVATNLRAGRSVLAATTQHAGEEGTPSLAPTLAAECGLVLASLLEKVPLRRIGIAGGDTSSHAVLALDIWGLEHAGLLAPGVALCRARSREPRLQGVEFMLKGGQMGPDDVFERLLHGS